MTLLINFNKKEIPFRFCETLEVRFSICYVFFFFQEKYTDLAREWTRKYAMWWEKWRTKPLEHTEKIKKKHTNSFFSKTTPDRIENPFILKSPSRYSKKQKEKQFFFKKIGLSIIFFSISLCPSKSKKL